MQCLEDSCCRIAVCKGFCHKHYKRRRWRELSPKKRLLTDPNEFIEHADYWEIKLYNKRVEHIASAKIDKEDIDQCREYKWGLHNAGYAVAKGGEVLLHRLVLGILDSSFEGDHIFGNRLDNRKSKLRICTHEQNARNTKLQKNNTSGFRGVYFVKSTGKWMASIQIKGKQMFLGYFIIKREAAKVYNKAAQLYFGEFAVLNKY